MIVQRKEEQAEQMPIGEGVLPFQAEKVLRFKKGKWSLNTPQGKRIVRDGDWILKDLDGRFLLVKAADFNRLYRQGIRTHY